MRSLWQWYKDDTALLRRVINLGDAQFLTPMHKVRLTHTRAPQPLPHRGGRWRT